jgi:hypothetical protein
MTAIRELIAEGWEITLEDLAVLSPYLTTRIQRVGVYATDEVALAPEPRPDGIRAQCGMSVRLAPPPVPGRNTRGVPLRM